MVSVMGCLGHAFHASCNHDFSLAALDGLGGHHDGFHAGGANLIDSRGGSVLAHFGAKSDLASWGLSHACLKDGTHDDLLDLGRVELATGEGSTGRNCTEMRGTKLGERAHEGTDGGSFGTDDDCAHHSLSGR